MHGKAEFATNILAMVLHCLAVLQITHSEFTSQTGQKQAMDGGNLHVQQKYLTDPKIFKLHLFDRLSTCDLVK